MTSYSSDTLLFETCKLCSHPRSSGSAKKSLPNQLAFRACHLHRLVHRGGEHVVNGKDRKPRSLVENSAGAKPYRARQHAAQPQRNRCVASPLKDGGLSAPSF